MNIPLHELKRMMEAGTPIKGICAASQYMDSDSGQNYISIEDSMDGGGCVTSLFIDDLGTMADAELFAAMRNALPSLLAVVESALKLRAAQHIIDSDADPDEVNWDAFAKAIEQHAELAAATDEALALFQGKEKLPASSVSSAQP